MAEPSVRLPIEVYNDSEIHAMSFSQNGKYLLCGDDEGVGVWQVEDGRKVTKMMTGLVHCLCVSKDGKWIAAGKSTGAAVWDAETHRPVIFALKYDYVVAVDFSPDSRRLATGSFNDGTATIWDWDVTQCSLALTLHHEGRRVIAVKYSHQGDRIATATHETVRVWDGVDGHLLVDIRIEVTPEYNNGILWSSDHHLFAISNDKIKRFDVSTGSELSECPVPNSVGYSCMALARHGEFIAYSTCRTIMFRHTSLHTHLAVIHHPQSLFFMVLSPDDRCLAIGDRGGKITITRLSHIDEPGIQIDDAILDLWKDDRLAKADALLTEVRNASYHVLASRALVRARLQRWDAALIDAEMAIEARPSVIGYVAKSVALLGMGEKREAYRACDIALEHFRSSHVSFLLLVKAIIVFIAGEHIDAISRMDNLITTVLFNSICYVIQAYMYFRLGNLCMRTSDYEGAVQLFERAQAQMRQHSGRLLLEISLIFGWKFDGLDVAIRRHLCEALCAVGRIRDAEESLLEIVNMFDEDSKWVSELSAKCLSTQEVWSAVAPKTLALLLGAWARTKLTTGSWKDALVAAADFVVPRFMVLRAIYERLETNGLTTDASECVHEMVDELVEQENPQREQKAWVLGKLENIGDTAMSAERLSDAIFHYSAALALNPAVPRNIFIKRGRAYSAGSLWEAALDDANKVIELDPQSPCGYEIKCTALVKAGDHENAIGALETMLSEMSWLTWSSDLGVYTYHRLHRNPGDTRVIIQNIAVSLPFVYDQVLGRLLARLLVGCGDTSILAWTGRSGSFNSCFPRDIAVFNQPPSSHVPPIIPSADMEVLTARLRSTFLDLSSARKLYDRLNLLRVPTFSGRRMTLPCIVFSIGRLSVSSEQAYCARTDALGVVKIRTKEDLTQFRTLFLVHPWINFLLDRRSDQTSSIASPSMESSQSRAPQPASSSPSSGRSFMSRTEKEIRAIQIVARLTRPFGALLLARNPADVSSYRRVAARSQITVRVKDITPAMVNKLVDSVHTLDVL